MSRWVWGRYAAGAAYPEGWIRVEEAPGARLVANLPPLRAAEAQAMVEAHNASTSGSSWVDNRADRFRREQRCTVGICRRPATRGPWCAEHYGMNNGD